MTTLKTQNNKSLILVSGSSSVIDERVITSNSGTNTLGSTISFNDVIGDGDRNTTQIQSLYYETNAKINSSTSSYEILHLCALWEQIILTINGVEVYKTTSSKVQQDLMYLQRLQDSTNTAAEFINEIAELGATVGAIDPYYYGDSSNVINGATASHRVSGAGRPLSFDLCQLWPDVFKNLQFHRIKTWGLQIKFRGDTGAALARYLKYTLVTDTEPSILPVFTDTQLRLKYKRSAKPVPDPIPASLPLCLVMDRYEHKDFGVVFNNTNTVFKISLSQNAGWTNIRNLSTTNIFFRSPTVGQFRSWQNAAFLSDLLGFKIKINGKSYGSYMNGQFRNYVNEYSVAKSGHYPYFQAQHSVSGGVPIPFVQETISCVRIDWTGITNYIGAHKNEIVVVGGVDNYQQTYEIELYCNPASFATSGPREGFNLEVINTSKTVISVYSDRRVESSYT